MGGNVTKSGKHLLQDCSRKLSGFLFFIVCGVLGLGSAMSAQTNDDELFPPIAPEGEEVSSASASFLDACVANSADLVAAGRWELGKPVVTRSGKWGTIWRVDFNIPGNNLSPLINRIICWQRPDDEKFKIMFAIGQSVSPLG